LTFGTPIFELETPKPRKLLTADCRGFIPPQQELETIRQDKANMETQISQMETQVTYRPAYKINKYANMSQPLKAPRAPQSTSVYYSLSGNQNLLSVQGAKVIIYNTVLFVIASSSFGD